MVRFILEKYQLAKGLAKPAIGRQGPWLWPSCPAFIAGARPNPAFPLSQVKVENFMDIFGD
jgi:hypothetical protein